MDEEVALARLRSVKGLLFDLDGTLVNLPIDYDRLRTRLRQHFIGSGIEDPPYFKPMLTTIDRLTDELRHMGRPEPEVLHVYDVAQEIVDEEENAGCEDATVLIGAKEVLRFLKTQGIPWAIVSRNKVPGITMAMKRTDLPYGEAVTIVGRDAVRASKPSRQHAMPALEAMHLEGKDVAVIGDSWHDIELARNIGALSVRVWQREVTKDVTPDVHLKTLLELIEAFRGR